MSGAIAGPGFFLQKGDGATPENFTTITEVKDIKGPAVQLDTTDVTNQSSPNNYEEVVATLKRGGEVTFDCNFQPGDASHDMSTGLLADQDNRTLRNFRLTMPNQARRWSFAAYVVKTQITEPVVGVLVMAVTLKIAGKPTLA